MTNIHHNSLSQAPAIKKQTTSVPTWSNSDKMIRINFAIFESNVCWPVSFVFFHQVNSESFTMQHDPVKCTACATLQSRTCWGGQFQQGQCFHFTPPGWEPFELSHLRSWEVTRRITASMANYDLIGHHLVKYEDCTTISGFIWTIKLWWLLKITFSWYSQPHATYKSS